VTFTAPFAGSPRAELGKCVAGPGVYICDRCVLDALACMMETEAPVTAYTQRNVRGGVSGLRLRHQERLISVRSSAQGRRDWTWRSSGHHDPEPSSLRSPGLGLCLQGSQSAFNRLIQRFLERLAKKAHKNAIS
jgi:hypothetical protein